MVLADRYFSGWYDLALLAQRGVDGVVRKHQLRATDFRTGRRLGKDDHVVTWPRPARPTWMSREQCATMPAELELREVRVRVEQKGFRTKSLVVVTTLVDAEAYPADQIATLYRQRWQAELNLRSLKIVLQMDHLRCKTPDRVRNEFRMHLVGYNLIRRVMAVAAQDAGRSPWEISFKGALQTVTNLLARPRCERLARRLVYGVDVRRRIAHCRPPSRSLRTSRQEAETQEIQTDARTA